MTQFPKQALPALDSRPRSDRQAIEHSLETTLVTAHGYLADWAVEEACNRGLASTLPFVRESIRKRAPSERAEFDIRNCEERIAILNSGNSRTQALASFLATGDLSSDSRLAQWALTLLARDDSPEATRAINVFRTRISAMPKDDSMKQFLAVFLLDLDLHPPVKRVTAK